MELLKRVVGVVKTGLRALSPDCREASRLQSEALDHSLSRCRRLGFSLHLLLCKWCRRYGNQVRFLRRAVREHPDKVNGATPQNLSPEARERFKQLLGDKSK